MQALQLPALFIFQADEKNKRRRVSQHSLRQTFLKAFLKKHIKTICQGNFIQLNHIKHSAFSAFTLQPWA